MKLHRNFAKWLIAPNYFDQKQLLEKTKISPSPIDFNKHHELHKCEKRNIHVN